MNRSGLPASITIPTAPERAVFFSEGEQDFIYPAQVKTPVGEFDFGDGGDWPDLGRVRDVSVELITDKSAQTVPLPRLSLHGIAGFLKDTPWGDASRYDCRTFAWRVSGVKKRGPGGREVYSEIDDMTSLEAGDLLAVGTVGREGGASIKHWAIHLAGGMALNITSRGGGLAGTPVANFQTLYPRTNTYKVTNYDKKWRQTGRSW